MGQACAERWRPRLSGWASRGAASSSISRARAPRPVSSRRATAPSRRRRKVQAMVSEGGGGTTSVSMRELLLRCPQCGATTSGDTTQFRCACGTLFDLPDASFGPAGESAEALRARFHGRLSALGGSARSGVWRYRELILPLAEEHIVSRQEGNTPLHAVGAGERDGWRKIGMYAGLERLILKHEGENPTGSFKDRGMTVGMSVARALGVRAVACASTGNTAASLAAYAAKTGLPALVFLPGNNVASGKLAQSIAYGARRVNVAGDFDDAMRQVEEGAGRLGIYFLNSINPHRLAGQPPIAYQPLPHAHMHGPDLARLPPGNLGNTSAIGAALLRAAERRLIARVPRLASVQATGADPFYRSFASGWRDFAPVHARTRATAVNIGAPVSYAPARAVVEATGGRVTAGSDVGD